jgi:hypothetical protein
MRRETLPRIEAIGEIGARHYWRNFKVVGPASSLTIHETDSLTCPKRQGEMRIIKKSSHLDYGKSPRLHERLLPIKETVFNPLTALFKASYRN